MKVKSDHRSKFSNLSNWKEAWKKSGLQRDSNLCGAMLYQLSYEATHWERGQRPLLKQGNAIRMHTYDKKVKKINKIKEQIEKSGLPCVASTRFGGGSKM